MWLLSLTGIPAHIEGIYISTPTALVPRGRSLFGGEISGGDGGAGRAGRQSLLQQAGRAGSLSWRPVWSSRSSPTACVPLLPSTSAIMEISISPQALTMLFTAGSFFGVVIASGAWQRAGRFLIRAADAAADQGRWPATVRRVLCRFPLAAKVALPAMLAAVAAHSPLAGQPLCQRQRARPGTKADCACPEVRRLATRRLCAQSLAWKPRILPTPVMTLLGRYRHTSGQDG